MSNFALAACILARLAVFAGTAYLVFWMGASGWWFLLAIVMAEMLGFKNKGGA